MSEIKPFLTGGLLLFMCGYVPIKSDSLVGIGGGVGVFIDVTSVLLLCSLAYCASFLTVSEAVDKTNDFLFCVRYLLFSLVFMIPFVVVLLLSGRVFAAFSMVFSMLACGSFFAIRSFRLR